MKALSIHQPWASLIIEGKKSYETRNNMSNHRGPLAIHSTRTMDFSQDTSVPYGSILGTVQMVDCWKLGEYMGMDPRINVHCFRNAFRPGEGILVNDREYQLGDYRAGRCIWVLKSPVALPLPVPARGFPGLWEWTPDAQP